MINTTQEEWVENILVETGKITRNKCLVNYVSRLGAIIAKLKNDGYTFDVGYIDVKTPFGTGRDYEYKVVSYPLVVQDLIDAGKKKMIQVLFGVKSQRNKSQHYLILDTLQQMKMIQATQSGLKHKMMIVQSIG